MGADAAQARRRAWNVLVVFSFVPFSLKAVGYAAIESYLPIFVFLVFVGIVVIGARAGPRARTLAVRIWASALVLWGVVRLGLCGLLLTTDIGEVHPVDQVTPWYVALSLAHALLGVILFRNIGHASEAPSGATAL